MMKDKSNNKIGKKWKSYITGIISSNFAPFNKIDKYFHYPISESTTNAIQENWIRILGIDNEIICMNLCKNNQPLGIALEGRNELSKDAHEVIQRHYIRAIMPTFCIGLTNKFMIKDEILEVNGLKVMGLPTKDVLRALKKLTNDFQIVVGRSIQQNYDLASDYGYSEDNINSPISFYDMDEDESSRNGTLRSVASNYSTTSRDFGSSVSFGGMIDGQYENVREYLRNMVGWRGPIVIDFIKHKESLGLALEEIPDPISSNLIIVFKIILPKMKAGKDGRLHAGDRLLQVNGKSVNGVQFRQVCKWIKSAPGGRLVLCICKPHFKPTSFDPKNSEISDKYFYNTLKDGDKLPKLSEETDNELKEIPVVPEYMEKHITLKRAENKLGVFFDIADDGKNGVRIKKMSHGIAKSDGRLKQGDFITQICGISLRVNDKIQLQYCLKHICASTEDYSISYITAEDLDLYKSKYCTMSSQRKRSIQQPVLISNIYPDPASITLEQTSNESDTEKAISDKPSKVYFETFDITIANNFETNLGIMLSPSLMEPGRLVSITHIHENSLCDKDGLLKINDEILKVNDIDFENIPVFECAEILNIAVKNESFIHFKIRRLMECENQIVDPFVEKLSKFHDFYHCTIRKSPNGFGFSLFELDNNVIAVGKIDLHSPAYKVGILKSGDRFAMINKCNVIDCAITTIMQLVKNSTKQLELVMEIPKYREFLVKISKDSTMSLGLNIAGGCDTLAPIPIIESLVPNRSSKFSEELFPGDLIFEVDGETLIQQNHSEIIQTLRSTGKETTFKIFRRLPYLQRKIFNDFELSDFPDSYLQSCQYSVIINKPVDNIKSFGINFTDVVIIDEKNEIKIVERYKIVFSIDKNSLAEKYAPEIKCNHFLIAINEVPVDVDILPEDLKDNIDKNNRIHLTLSKDIPYNIKEKIKDYDSPMLLTKSKHSFQSKNSSVDTDSIQSNIEPHNEIVSVTLSEYSNDVTNSIKTQSNCVEEKSSLTENSEVNNRNTTDINSQVMRNSTNSLSDKTDDNTEDKNNNRSSFTENSEMNNDNTSENKIDDTEVQTGVDNDNNKPNSIEISESNNEHTSDINSEEAENSNTSLDKTDSPNIEISCNNDTNESTEPMSNNNNDQVNQDESLEDNKNDLDSNNQSIENSIDMDTQEVESSINSNNESVDKSSPNDVESNNLSDLGIDINYITVKKVANVELGIQLYGGLEGGPNGETIPVLVVGVEKNTCNWPVDSEKPLLKNGQQVIELNGQILSGLKLSKIETIIKETDDELKFKIVTFK